MKTTINSINMLVQVSARTAARITISNTIKQLVQALVWDHIIASHRVSWTSSMLIIPYNF